MIMSLNPRLPSPIRLLQLTFLVLSFTLSIRANHEHKCHDGKIALHDCTHHDTCKQHNMHCHDVGHGKKFCCAQRVVVHHHTKGAGLHHQQKGSPASRNSQPSGSASNSAQTNAQSSNSGQTNAQNSKSGEQHKKPHSGQQKPKSSEEEEESPEHHGHKGCKNKLEECHAKRRLCIKKAFKRLMTKYCPSLCGLCHLHSGGESKEESEEEEDSKQSEQQTSKQSAEKSAGTSAQQAHPAAKRFKQKSKHHRHRVHHPRAHRRHLEMARLIILNAE